MINGSKCKKFYRNRLLGGFEKHRDSSTSFVAPLFIVLNVTLTVTLSAHRA